MYDRPRRVLGLILALWFAIGMVEPPLLHRCPMHDGVGAWPMSHEGHAHQSHAPGGHSGPHQCTCPGSCCVAPALALPVARVAAAPLVVIDAGEPWTPPLALVPSSAPHALPFANGPPHAPAA